MPFYSFQCPNCNHTMKKLLASEEKARDFSSGCELCGTAVQRVMGMPATISKETVDEGRGKSVETDLDSKIRERSREHFLKHDLPRIIQEHGREFAERQGYIDAEGNTK